VFPCLYLVSSFSFGPENGSNIFFRNMLALFRDFVVTIFVVICLPESSTAKLDRAGSSETSQLFCTMIRASYLITNCSCYSTMKLDFVYFPETSLYFYHNTVSFFFAYDLPQISTQKVEAVGVSETSANIYRFVLPAPC
jgi:hypothetical protein